MVGLPHILIFGGMKWIQWLFWAGMVLAFGGCTGEEPARGPELPSRQRVYLTLVTDVAGGDYKFGDLRDINRTYCLQFDRMTDSTEIWLACYEFTLLGVFHRLMFQLDAHPGAKAHLLFDPALFAATQPNHRLALLDSLRNFSRLHPGQLVLENDLNPQAGLFGQSDPENPARMHAKFLVMNHLAKSDLDTFKHFLLVSSANLSYSEAAESNEAVILPEHPTLERAAIEYFKAMAKNAAAPPQYFVQEDKVGLWLFPAPNGSDPIRAILDTLKAKIPNLSKFPDPMRIRIAISHWDSTRAYLADSLVELGQSPYVDAKLVLRDDWDISPMVYQRLNGLGEGRVRTVPVRNEEAKNGIHSKLILVEYPTEEGMQYRVWWGSHNWNMPSLAANSEMLCQINDFEVYYAMWTHWNQLWKAGLDSTKIFDLAP